MKKQDWFVRELIVIKEAFHCISHAHSFR